jgi:hypothetical protein
MLLDPKTGRVFKEVGNKNLVLYGGADILAKLLAGNSNYALAGMYIEFENQAGTPTPPAFDRSATKSYYDSLGGDPLRDYLRIPFASSPLLAPSSADYNFNRLSLFAVTSGTTGVHGKSFSSASDSTVFGAALFSSPDPTDSTQDVIYARTYSIGAIARAANLEVGVNWNSEIL